MKKIITLFLLVIISVNYLSIIENICFLHNYINKKETSSLKKSFNSEDSEKDVDDETDDETEKNQKEKINEKYVSLNESLINLFVVNKQKQTFYFSVQLISPPFIDKDGPPPNFFA
ncbi:MAG: hypothetical protein NT127_08790 [Sphingobacteriales bacterium]|nr:hypothetical protein [Sphingobacteriales bacterium]